jgi:SPP1 family predicted phage head-tail adaptor
MRAGDLRRRVTIQKRQSTQDGDGQRSETWTAVATVPAKIEPLGGRELLLAKAMGAESTHQVTMRYRADLDATMRIVYQGRIFNINNLNDPDARHEAVVAMCTEGANVG